MRHVAHYAAAVGLAASLLLVGAGCSTSQSSDDKATDTAKKTAVTAPATPIAPVAGYQYYDETQKLGFRFQLPKDWDKDESWDGDDLTVGFYAPLEGESDAYRENIVVTALHIPADEVLDLKDFANQSIEGLKKSVQKLVTTDEGETTFAGAVAHKYTFTGQISNEDGSQTIKLKGQEYFVIHNDKAYNFTYGAGASKFDATLPTINKIFATFELN